MEASKADKIYAVIGAIPAGSVASYGQVAKLAGLPANARLVGTLLKQIPADSTLPWYRVINAQGRISFAEGSKDYLRQFQALCGEGIEINKGRINLSRYGWQP